VGDALRLVMLVPVANDTPHAVSPRAALASAPRVALLEREAQAGDRRAIELLLREHAALLLTICQHVVGPNDARDALQEALERLVRQLARFDPAEGTFRTWASTVTRNVCRDRLRRRGLERAAFSRDGDEQAGSAPSVGPDPERQAIARQGAGALAEALAGLPAQMRTALMMFHVHEASYEEIARALEVPMGTVMTWLHRGRQRLRSAVEEP
jgi:RNA polymerase sigma-70 factor (ECF subfamily)